MIPKPASRIDQRMVWPQLSENNSFVSIPNYAFMLLLYEFERTYVKTRVDISLYHTLYSKPFGQAQQRSRRYPSSG